MTRVKIRVIHDVAQESRLAYLVANRNLKTSLAISRKVDQHIRLLAHPARLRQARIKIKFIGMDTGLHEQIDHPGKAWFEFNFMARTRSGLKRLAFLRPYELRSRLVDNDALLSQRRQQFFKACSIGCI